MIFVAGSSTLKNLTHFSISPEEDSVKFVVSDPVLNIVRLLSVSVPFSTLSIVISDGDIPIPIADAGWKVIIIIIIPNNIISTVTVFMLYPHEWS